MGRNLEMLRARVVCDCVCVCCVLVCCVLAFAGEMQQHKSRSSLPGMSNCRKRFKAGACRCCSLVALVAAGGLIIGGGRGGAVQLRHLGRENVCLAQCAWVHTLQLAA